MMRGSITERQRSIAPHTHTHTHSLLGQLRSFYVRRRLCRLRCSPNTSAARRGVAHVTASPVIASPSFIMVALCNRANHYIFILFLSSSFFFSSPNLTGRRLDVYTSTHGVALVRIQNARLKCAASSSLKIQDAKKSPKIAISAPSHSFVRLYLCNKACIDNGKKTC